jgi:hypothetical protein
MYKPKYYIDDTKPWAVSVYSLLSQSYDAFDWVFYNYLLEVLPTILEISKELMDTDLSILTVKEIRIVLDELDAILVIG